MRCSKCVDLVRTEPRFSLSVSLILARATSVGFRARDRRSSRISWKANSNYVGGQTDRQFRVVAGRDGCARSDSSNGSYHRYRYNIRVGFALFTMITAIRVTPRIPKINIGDRRSPSRRIILSDSQLPGKFNIESHARRAPVLSSGARVISIPARMRDRASCRILFALYRAHGTSSRLREIKRERE